MRTILAFALMLVSLGASAQPFTRNFFTTNPAPVVQVTAGTNVNVTFSAAGSTRTYRVDVPALGGVSNIYVASGTGIQITTNGSLYTFAVSNPLPVIELDAGTLVVTNPPVLNLSASTNLSGATGIQSGTINSNALDVPTKAQLALAGSINNYNISVTNATFAITATNSPSSTVAGLPTPSGTYPRLYATDAVTSFGVGSYVQWDGSQWVTMENIVATASVPQFMRNALAIGLNVSTPLTWARFYDMQIDSTVDTAEANLLILKTGTGSTVGQATASGIDFMQFVPGTDATGRSGGYGGQFQLASGDYFQESYRVQLPAITNATDWFWVHVGADVSQTTFGSRGYYFLYDPTNATGIAVANSTHWLCVTRQGSVSTATVIDSGLTVTAGAWVNLSYLATSTNCVFFTNGVACATNSANIPVGGLYSGVIFIKKTAGSVDKDLWLDWWSPHWRHATARSLN